MDQRNQDRLGQFAPIDGTWLNTAHQGVLPLPAAVEAHEAVAWKQAPYELSQERFNGVPKRLRRALGRLVGTASEDIILANSASYGLHLIANAFPFHEGNEVVVMEGDFPSDILPWLRIEQTKGIKVVRIRPRERVVSPDELRAAISRHTRLFCVTWVHSFSGHAVDLEGLGRVCREHGVIFVLNGSQALGARRIDLSSAPVDVLSCAGFKWLCGPYGSGFCWIRPELRMRLQPQKAYWLAQSTAEDLKSEVENLQLRTPPSAAAHDVFGTANFFVFKPFAAAVEHILEIGVDRIEAHDQMLVDRFISALDGGRYAILSPARPGPTRSTLVLLSHRDRGRNAELYQELIERRIWIALRAGQLRMSPHLYNSPEEIDRVAALFNDLG